MAYLICPQRSKEKDAKTRPLSSLKKTLKASKPSINVDININIIEHPPINSQGDFFQNV